MNSVALECFVNNFALNVEQANADVTTFCDAGNRTIVDSYAWNSEISGPWDGAAGALDATLYGLIASTGVAFSAEMTGATGGANAPEYTGTVVLESYSIKAAVGQAITYSAKLNGNSALTRDAA